MEVTPGLNTVDYLFDGFWLRTVAGCGGPGCFYFFIAEEDDEEDENGGGETGGDPPELLPLGWCECGGGAEKVVVGSAGDLGTD